VIAQRESGKAGWAVLLLVAVATAVAVVAVLWLDATGEKGSGLSNEYVYNIAELARIDPNLILYSLSKPPIETGFRESRAIAVDSGGRMYVAGDKAIRVFNDAGQVERTVDVAGEPQCLAVAADARIYVGLRDRVEVLDNEGRTIASWDSLGREAFFTSIARHGEDVFVADAGGRVVLHYDAAGKLLGRIGEKDADRNVPGFIVPSPHLDLAVSSDGLLRVVNPGRLRIETYTLAGDFEFSWGEASTKLDGFCGCCNPVNFALLPNGWFVTSEKGLDRIKLYNSDGGFVGVVAGPEQLGRTGQMKICISPEQCQGGALDVAAGLDGRVYVLDTAANTIRIFSRKEVKP
jgi:hypothetical protein